MPLTESEELELLELEELEAMGSAPEPEEGLMADLSARGEEIGNIVSGGYPDQSVLSDAYQVGTNVLGGAADVVEAGIGSAVDAIGGFVPDSLKEGAKDVGGALMEKMQGLYTPEQLQEIKDTYGDIKTYHAEISKNHPELARNIGATGDLIMGAPAAKLLSSVTPSLKTMGIVKDAIKKKQPVSLEDLKIAEGEAYKSAKEIASSQGTLINSNRLNKVIDFETSKAFSPLALGRIDADVDTYAYKAMEKVKDRLSGNIDPAEIENTRKLLNSYVDKASELGRITTDAKKVLAIKSALDTAADSLDTKDFIKGDKEFISAFKEARKISSVRHKVEPIQDIFDRAKNAPKGSSYEVSLKNGFRNLANNKRKFNKYTAEEKFLINQAARTGTVEGLSNKLGVFSPTSGKLGMAIGGGIGYGAASNPALLALPVAGMAGKAISDKMARSSAEKAFQGIAGQLNPQKSLVERARSAYGKDARAVLDKMKEQKGAITLGNDLPMDKASRMQRAKEQGFDVDNPVYHGTRAENVAGIEKAGFDLGKSKSTSKANPSDLGVWFVDDVNYAQAHGDEVIKAFTKSSKPKVYTREAWDKLDKKGDFVALRKKLIEDGYDGIKVRENIEKLGRHEVRNPAMSVAFDPKNIRSTQAKFDPKKKKSANILAGGAGATTAATIATQENK